MTTRLLPSILLLAAACLASCDSGDAPAPTGNDAAGGNARADWPDEIRFGLIPSEGGTDIVETFKPLAGFLSEALGVPVVFQPANQYAGVITAMQNRQVEFAYFGPKSYCEAARIANAEAIVKELNAEGREGYHSLLVVPQGSEVRSLEDAKGLTLGMVSPSSTSGYLVPTIGIMEATGSLPAEYFDRIIFAGSHGAVMTQVAQGDLPIGACNDLDLLTMTRKGLIPPDALEIIWESALIPASPIAARRDLPASLKDAMRDALVGFGSETEALAAMGRSGWVPATDADYDSVRLLEQKREEMAAEHGE